jgi:hypothetical protein
VSTSIFHSSSLFSPARRLPRLLAVFALAFGCSEPARQAPSPPAPTDPAAADPTVTAPPSPTATATADASASSATPAPDASASAAASASASPAAPVAGARIWGKSRFTWIHPSPWVSGAWTGYVGLGLSAPLKGGSLETARVAQGGRCNAWYAIEPTGYVCAGDTASVDPADPLTAALIRDAGDPDSPWPFEYGESMNTPRYDHIPTLAEMRRDEWDLPAHMAKVAKARAAKTPEEVAAIDKEFVGMDFTPAGTTAGSLANVTVFVRVHQKYVVKGSTIAWVRAFDVEYPTGELGFTTRTFVLTADHAIIPKDRIKPYPKSKVQGVKLGDDVRLPIAFFRKAPRPKYKRGPDGAMVATGDTWPAKSWTMVTGEEVTVGKDKYVVTREEGIFAKAEDAHVVPLATPPSGKILEAPGRGTWLDISVLGGWVVAYEKTKPILATLISPGRGGIPYPGIDPLKTASTPLGNFRVDGKFRWATMVSSSNSDIVHSEVQYVQNFHGPHALHGAYWHDSFGEPKSGGCINLSPIDSKWFFDFTEPSLPDGWHGLRSTDQAGYATIVSVHR